MVRGEQLGVDRRGLALDLSRMLHDVYLDGELDTGDEIPDGGKGHVTRVAKKFPRLVANITGLTLLT